MLKIIWLALATAVPAAAGFAAELAELAELAAGAAAGAGCRNYTY